jgi:hypothetical protein
MKKLIIIAIAFSLVLGATSVFAQVASGISGKGLKVGLNMANLTGSDVKNTKIKMGFIGGGFITYSFSDLFAIEPEVLFVMKGAKSDVTNPVTLVKTTESLKLNYIEIPVLLKVLLAGGGNVKPNFYIGPAVDFLMSAKFNTTDVKDSFKSTNICLVGGVGADFLMGSNKLTVDVRYTAGMGTIAKEITVPISYKPKVKTADISFLAGISF